MDVDNAEFTKEYRLTQRPPIRRQLSQINLTQESHEKIITLASQLGITTVTVLTMLVDAATPQLLLARMQADLDAKKRELAPKEHD